ncbi:MAG: DUF3048 domain-containing protein [Actinomycetota bacterium]|nr:DUF3048 domain-containing protein [Actinomycetota bacterium]
MPVSWPPRPATAPFRHAAVLALLALAGACSSGSQAAGVRASTTSSESPSSSSSTEAPTTTTTLPPVYPLTGRPVDNPGIAARPAVSVKIDNIAEARPQAGIGAADVVYEEFTEGITRFIVVFHSNDADLVGPVRSVRPADPVITGSLGGVLGFSGGSPAAVALATASTLTTVTENNQDVMYRRPGRVAPHNLYTSSAGLRSKAPAGAGPPVPLAGFLRGGEEFGGPGAVPVAGMTIVPAPYVTAGYDWDTASSTWLRSTDGRPHLLDPGGRIAPTTVVVQFTPYLEFAADSKVQYPDVLGTGEARVFAAGKMVKGTWSKPNAETPTALALADGTPIKLPPGQTWFHLVAPGSSVTVG